MAICLGVGFLPLFPSLFGPTTYPMTDTSIETAETAEPSADNLADRHADKYNDPRAKITRRGIGIGLLVAVFAVLGAAASIYGRRTRLVESTRYWGDDTILALQLAEKIELLPRRGREFPEVDLTGTPGLGHLRRALLDERNYDWESVSEQSVLAHSEGDDENTLVITLRLTDPTVHRFETVLIDIDLKQGWLGHADEPRSVRYAERKRSGLRHYLITIMNKEKNRYDLRDR